MVIRFIEKVQRQQNRMDETKMKAIKCPLSQSNAQDTLKKLNSNSKPLKVGDITIKKVWSIKTEDPLNVLVKNEPLEPQNIVLIKQEPVCDMEASNNIEASNDGSSNASSDSEEMNSDNDDDEDYCAEEEKPRRTNAHQAVENLSFTCAKCKLSFSDFQILTVHITSRVS